MITGTVTSTTPSPSGDPVKQFDPNEVSPGLAGFLAVFAIALICIGLFFGLSRQMRRMRHNAQVRGIPLDDGPVKATIPMADDTRITLDGDSGPN